MKQLNRIHRWMVCRVCWTIVLLFALIGPAQAETAQLFDVYSLQATAEGMVANDYLEARLVVEYDSDDSAHLAGLINADMQWALEQLVDYPQINRATENYSTWPKYEQNRIVGWRASQTLVLGSTEFAAARAAIQILQQQLKIRGMQFRPREETLQSLEDDLIIDALDNFKHRASLVQHNMDAINYRIVRLDINTGHNNPSARMRMQAERGKMAQAASIPAPALEAGESRVAVTVRGEIQLQ